jgi:hypothetical protein
MRLQGGYNKCTDGGETSGKTSTWKTKKEDNIKIHLRVIGFEYRRGCNWLRIVSSAGLGGTGALNFRVYASIKLPVVIIIIIIIIIILLYHDASNSSWLVGL